MYHSIEFRLLGLAEMDVPGKLSMAQVAIKQGTRLKAQVKPYVKETKFGPVEVADLLLEDGSVARAVRYATFRFLDD